MKESYSIPNKINTAVVLSQVALIFSCFYLLSHCTSVSYVVSLGLFFAVLMNSVYSSIHEAHHRMLFSNHLVNDACGIFLSIFFPAPFHLLKQGHLGHHKNNRSDDEAFDLYFDYDNKIWKFVAWYGILLGLYWVVVALSNFIVILMPFLLKPKIWKWDRTSEVFLSHFSSETYRIMQCEALGAIAFHIVIVWLFAIPFMHYAIMYYMFGLLWSSLQYVHHYQTERDVILGAKNLHIVEPIDLILLNHNWHKTHHQAPKVPWIYLRKLSEKDGTQSKSLVPAYFMMWRGPKLGIKQAISKFQGDVSR